MNRTDQNNPFQKSTEIMLTDRERDLLRNNILSFMRTESIRQSMDNTRRDASRSNWLLFFGGRSGSFNYRLASTLIIIAVLVSGGTTFAAQSSLPGDILYPIKVGVTEKVQGALTVSDEARATWEAELAQRRLVEAEELAAQGRLNAKTGAEIKERLTAHTIASAQLISDLNTQFETESAAKVASSLEASLEVHEKILTDLDESVPDKNTTDNRSTERKENDAQIQPILKALRDDLNAMTRTRLRTEADMSVRAEIEKQKTAERSMKNARTKIRETESFIKKNKSSIDEKSFVQANTDIMLAHEAFSAGEEEFEAKEYGDAFVSFQESIRASQRVKLSIEAAVRIEARAKEKRRKDEKELEREQRRNRESHSPSPSASPSPSESPKSFWRHISPPSTPHPRPELETEIKADFDGFDSGIKVEVEGTGDIDL